jgi:hypothetical protein
MFENYFVCRNGDYAPMTEDDKDDILRQRAERERLRELKRQQQSSGNVP